jgi:hypothetical protein
MLASYPYPSRAFANRVRRLRYLFSRLLDIDAMQGDALKDFMDVCHILLRIEERATPPPGRGNLPALLTRLGLTPMARQRGRSTEKKP